MNTTATLPRYSKSAMAQALAALEDHSAPIRVSDISRVDFVQSRLEIGGRWLRFRLANRSSSLTPSYKVRIPIYSDVKLAATDDVRKLASINHPAARELLNDMRQVRRVFERPLDAETLRRAFIETAPARRASASRSAYVARTAPLIAPVDVHTVPIQRGAYWRPVTASTGVVCASDCTCRLCSSRRMSDLKREQATGTSERVLIEHTESGARK